MSDILLAVLIVAGIGLVAGLGLSIASVVMAVPKDEKAEEILSMLPGANCGACGYSGCSGYAAALSAGTAQIGLCSPGGAELAKSLSETLGVASSGVDYRTAEVHCNGTFDNTTDKMQYHGIPSCAAAMQLAGGSASCAYGCLGFGDCAAVCEYGAIKVQNGVASVDPKYCRGCKKCVAACPKHLISFEHLKPRAVVLCSSCDRGSDTRKVCKVGCIGCMRCEKVCEEGAIQVENFLARVDASKCTACGKCADVCPQHCITMQRMQHVEAAG